jgi:hypothetical protein
LNAEADLLVPGDAAAHKGRVVGGREVWRESDFHNAVGLSKLIVQIGHEIDVGLIGAFGSFSEGDFAQVTQRSRGSNDGRVPRL